MVIKIYEYFKEMVLLFVFEISVLVKFDVQFFKMKLEAVLFILV